MMLVRLLCTVLLAVLVPSLVFGATAATLPRSQVDTTLLPINGSTFNATCATLQAQLNAAAVANINLNHEVVLAAASNCSTRFDLPSHNGGTGWIYLKGGNYASLPPPGTRVGLSNVALMPTLQTNALTGSSAGTIQAVTGAQRYRIIGIHFTQNDAVDNNNWISFGWGNSVASNTGYFILDRVVIEDTNNTHRSGRAVLADADLGNVAMLDSYCDGIKSNVETQCFQYDISAGPTLVQNNFLSACGEVAMVGGGTSKDSARHPSDITFRLNSFSVPSYCWGTGTGFVTKSSLEFKTGKFILIDANTFSNQPENDIGYAHRLTSRNPFGGDTWAQLSDLTIRNNLYVNINNWLQIFTTDIAGAGGSNGPTVHGQRWTITNNLVYGLGFRCSGGGCSNTIGMFTANGNTPPTCTDPTPDGCGMKDFIFAHNTVDKTVSGNLFCVINPTHINLEFRDNLLNNRDGRGLFNCNTGADGVGTAVLNLDWNGTGSPTWSWVNNTIAVGTIGGGFNGEGASSHYPGGTNSYPSSSTSFLWTNPGAFDYTLQAGSPAKNSASDGTDRGVNFTTFNAARNGGDGTPPSIPSGLRIVGIVGAKKVNLAWDDSIDDTGVTGYQLEHCAGVGCSVFVLAGSPATASFTDNGILTATSYTFRVRAFDAAGNFSGYSSTLTQTTDTVKFDLSRNLRRVSDDSLTSLFNTYFGGHDEAVYY